MNLLIVLRIGSVVPRIEVQQQRPCFTHNINRGARLLGFKRVLHGTAAQYLGNKLLEIQGRIGPPDGGGILLLLLHSGRHLFPQKGSRGMRDFSPEWWIPTDPSRFYEDSRVGLCVKSEEGGEGMELKSSLGMRKRRRRRRKRRGWIEWAMPYTYVVPCCWGLVFLEEIEELLWEYGGEREGECVCVMGNSKFLGEHMAVFGSLLAYLSSFSWLSLFLFLAALSFSLFSFPFFS